jgi:hypothetical protein
MTAFRLNWCRSSMTGACWPIADDILVFARIGDVSGGTGNISAFIVDAKLGIFQKMDTMRWAEIVETVKIEKM